MERYKLYHCSNYWKPVSKDCAKQRNKKVQREFPIIDWAQAAPGLNRDRHHWFRHSRVLLWNVSCPIV